VHLSFLLTGLLLLLTGLWSVLMYVLLTGSNNVLTGVATSPLRRVPLCGACVRV